MRALIFAYIFSSLAVLPEVVDRVCAIVSPGEAIFLSDVKTREQQKSISKKEALDELLQEWSLISYAKDQLKYGNLNELKSLAHNNYEKFKQQNGFTNKDLRERPYYANDSQLIGHFFYMLIESQIKSDTYKKTPLEEEVLKKHYSNLSDLVFISVKGHDKKSSLSLINDIRSSILKNFDLEKVKALYKGKGVSFVGPMEHLKGDLDNRYEEILQKNSATILTEPFDDSGQLTIIWKQKKVANFESLSPTALEDLKKQIYEEIWKSALMKIRASSIGKFTIVSNCVN